MAPFRFYLSKSSKTNHNRISAIHQERALTPAESHRGCKDGLTFQDINEAVPGINFRRCPPPSPSTELYTPLQTKTPALTTAQLVTSSLPTSKAIEQSAVENHFRSSEIVGVTLAFLSVVLGLIAMAMTRSLWYRRKQVASGMVLARAFSCRRKRGKGRPATHVDPFCSQAHINPPETYSPALNQVSFEDERSFTGCSPQPKLYTIGEVDEFELASDPQKFTSHVVEQECADFPNFVVQEESPESASSEIVASEYEMAISQESGSSEQTGGNGLERFSNPSSSRTSITSVGDVEEEEMEEGEESGEVHRAQTQSMAFKRAVLVSFPQGGHMTVMHRQ